MPARHPALVALRDLVRQQNEVYLIYPFVEGLTLRQFLRAGAGGLGRREEELLAVFRDICQGLEAMHQAGWYHGDLKPQNILLLFCDGKIGGARVIDFGKASPFYRASEPVGDFPLVYAAPEMILGAYTLVDARSDVYSLGLLLYETIGGQRPYHHEHPELLIQMMLNLPLPPDPVLAPELNGLLQRSTAKPVFGIPPVQMQEDEKIAVLQEAIGRRPESAGAFLDTLLALKGNLRRKMKWWELLFR